MLVGIAGARVWDGVDGSVPVDLDTGTLAEPYLSVVGRDGTLYGTDRDRVVMWATPSSTPTVLVDLGTGDGLGIFAEDEHGNLLGRTYTTKDGAMGVCIDPADPVFGITKLAPREGAEFGFGLGPLGGWGGRVYGHSSGEIVSWDIAGAEGGCRTVEW